MNRCRDCNQPILWGETPASRWVPFEPNPDQSAGYWVLTPTTAGMAARMLPDGPERQRAMRDNTPLHMPHHCPARNPRY